MKHLINFLLLVVPFVSVTAQKTIDQGYVKMEITEATSDDPQMAMGLEMLKGSMAEIFFIEGKYKTTMNMMGGMIKMDNFVDTKTSKMDLLFDAMGSKMWVDTNLDEAKKNKPAQADMEDFKVEYNRDETKEILGYKAFKATITMPGSADMKVEGWVTDQIKTDANIIQGMEDLKLEGFPLEFSMINPQMRMTFKATDIKDSVDAGVFELKTGGYQKMTMEEFSKQMGAMGGGMGF